MDAYKERVESESQLNQIFENNFDDVEKLNKSQIEKIVFYLKSRHSYYEDSENSWNLKDKFDERLNLIKFSDKQIQLQNTGAKLLRKAAIFNAICGILFAGFLITALLKIWVLSIILLCLTLPCYYFANSKFIVQALLTYKEQDRRYFLESLWSAKGCNELDWAGFYAYYDGQHLGSQSNEDEANTKIQIEKITQNFRDALYNDEYFNYTKS